MTSAILKPEVVYSNLLAAMMDWPVPSTHATLRLVAFTPTLHAMTITCAPQILATVQPEIVRTFP